MMELYFFMFTLVVNVSPERTVGILSLPPFWRLLCPLFYLPLAGLVVDAKKEKALPKTQAPMEVKRRKKT